MKQALKSLPHPESRLPKKPPRDAAVDFSSLLIRTKDKAELILMHTPLKSNVFFYLLLFIYQELFILSE